MNAPTMRAMGVGSIFVGIAAFLLMVGGILLAVIPFLGVTMSFAAPALCIAGIALAGVAMSRAKRDGESSSAAVAGLTINIIGFLISTFFALTCGLCGACVSNAYMNGDLDRRRGNKGLRMHMRLPDGGLVEVDPWAPSAPSSAPPPSNLDPAAPPADPAPPRDPNAPPPAMPPPPIETPTAENGAPAAEAPAPAPAAAPH